MSRRNIRILSIEESDANRSAEIEKIENELKAARVTLKSLKKEVVVTKEAIETAKVNGHLEPQMWLTVDKETRKRTSEIRMINKEERVKNEELVRIEWKVEKQKETVTSLKGKLKYFKENRYNRYFDIPEPTVEIKEHRTNRNIKFMTDETQYTIEFNEERLKRMTDISKIQDLLITAIDFILNQKIENPDENDRIIIKLTNDSDKYSTYTPLSSGSCIITDNLASGFIQTMAVVLQSWQTNGSLGNLNIDVFHYRIPDGGARGFSVKTDAAMNTAKSVILIHNEKDMTCLERSVVVCSEHLALLNIEEQFKAGEITIEQRNEVKKRWAKVKDNRYRLQGQLAMELCKKTNRDPMKRAKFGDIAVLEKETGYRIKVYSSNGDLIHIGTEKITNIAKFIYLRYDHEAKHFDAITNIRGYFATDRYCMIHDSKSIKCQQCQTDKNECNICRLPGISHYDERDEFAKWIVCDACNCLFPTTDCYDYHKVTVCDEQWKCQGACNVKYILNKEFLELVKDLKVDLKTAGEEIESIDKHSFEEKRELIKYHHVCFAVRCNNCGVREPREKHRCFILPKQISTKKTQYFWYDFESEQIETSFQAEGVEKVVSSRRHVVNHAQVIDEEADETHQFWSEDINDNGCKTALDLFMEWVIQPKHKDAIFIAHNAKGYDCILIREYLLKRGIKPECISPSGKIIQMTISKGYNIRFIDSLCFFGTALKKLPKMFGFEDLVKGHFPHNHNTKANLQKGSGPFPPLEDFEPRKMKKEDMDELIIWHQKEAPKHNDTSYKYVEELSKYCRSDVLVLRRACQEFRKIILQLTDNKIEPFQCCTVASLAMLIYRNQCMPLNKIAVLQNDKMAKDAYSAKSIEWLEYIAKEEGYEIKHMENSITGEVRIKNIGKVDGFAMKDGWERDEQTRVMKKKTIKHVFEFNGCYWHGCPKHQDPKGRIRTTGMFMEQALRLTERKEKRLERDGFIVHSMWECEWDEFKKDNIVQDKKSALGNPGLFNPRDAFFGGRTEAVKVYHEVKENEKILYYDIRSLYPTIMSYGVYPIGHPIIYRKNDINDNDISSYRGVIYCDVMPPTNLYHPLLPSHINGKNVFTLCRKCAEDVNQKPCKHVKNGRVIRGGWTHFEIQKAITSGYKVLEVHEVHHFERFACGAYDSNRTEDTVEVLPSVYYEPQATEDGLFSEYIKLFFKIKTESEKWPVINELEIEAIEKKEGISIDRTKLTKDGNPGLRSVAKMFLNSLWGKYGERSNFTTIKYIDDPAEWFRMIRDPNIAITDVKEINKDIFEVSSKAEAETIADKFTSNIYLAIFTTSMARLKLYEALEALDERVLYCDTDSVVFVAEKGKTGEDYGLTNSKYFLGDWADELGGDYINIFATAGPKNYAYITSKGKTICKIKGFTLNVENSEKLNLSSMCDIIAQEGQQEVPIETEDFSIRFSSKERDLVSVVATRKYSFEITKRIVNWENKKTYPYGYLKQ
jgi:G:T-mismatch repair DNA endonuclease (very short patch repair protein)